jgi:bacterioferritin (cytochrome b1)
MSFTAWCILLQDQLQLSKQAKNDAIKQSVMYQTLFDNEEHIHDITNMLKKYKYADKTSVLNLYNYHKLT